MSVESVTYINNLDPSLPSGGDSIAEGDDHIRNVKKGIKATFPSVTGEVTATHTQLNDVSKISGLETRVGDLEGVGRDELGGAKYNSLNGAEWTSGIVGSITAQSKSTYLVNFKTTLSDAQYTVSVTPFAAAAKPIFGYVINQQPESVMIKFSEWDGSKIQDATEAGFTLLIMDAHDA